MAPSRLRACASHGVGLCAWRGAQARKKQRALEQQAAVERAALQSALEGESTQAKLKAAAAEDEKKAFIEKSKVPLPPFSALSRAPPPSSAVPRPLPRSYRTHHHRP